MVVTMVVVDGSLHWLSVKGFEDGFGNCGN